MEDPSLEVDFVKRLQNHMILALEQLKAFHLTVSSLMVDLAAVRRTTIVTEKANSQYRLNLAKAMREAKPLLDEAARSFDDQISSVNNQMRTSDRDLSESAGRKFH